MLFENFEAKIDPLSFNERGHVMSWRMDNKTMHTLSFVFGEMLHAYEREVRESCWKDSKIFAENAQEAEEKLALMRELWREIDLELRADEECFRSPIYNYKRVTSI